jgi:hypothetical protein
MPYLLTNLPKNIKVTPKNNNKNDITKLQYPNPIELAFPLKISRAKLDKHFTLIEGEINLEGSWVCDIQTEFTGPLYLQIVFVKNAEDSQHFLDILGIFNFLL